VWQWARLKKRSLVVLVVVVAAVGAVVFAPRLLIWWQVVSINNHIDQLPIDVEEKRGTNQARIVGRLVPVDRQSKRVSDLYYDLPEEIRASWVDDVGTIARLEEEQTTTNDLTTQVCTLTLIDRDRKVVMSTEVFRRIGTGGPGSLHNDILEHLKKLPRVPRKK
jgi:hypothetical protein